MDSLVKNNENKIFEDLEVATSGKKVSNKSSSNKLLYVSGESRAQELSGKDKYRVAKINVLDVFGWVLTLLVLWAIYTVFSNFFNYFFSSGEISSRTSKVYSSSLEPKVSALQPSLSDIKDKASLLMHNKTRLKNSKALSVVEQRLNSISDLSEVGKTVPEEEFEDEPSRFSLGRAIQSILNEDVSR